LVACDPGAAFTYSVLAGCGALAGATE